MTSPLEVTEAHQNELRCPNCAGQQAFEPTERALICSSCGVHASIELKRGTDPAQETRFDPETLDTDPPRLEQHKVHSCTACGGRVTFIGAALSERCPYCDGPVVLSQQDAGFETMALIPFEVPRDAAQRHMENWLKRRWAAPRALGMSVQKGHMAGLYAPFWTFDSVEAVDYWARYKVKRGKRTVSRTASGRLRLEFDDLLMPASPHVTPLLRDGVLHEFKPDSLVPYQPEFLAGFAAEGHHETVAYGLRANEADKDVLIRNKIKYSIGKRGVHDIRYKTDTTGIHYRRILLPMWIHHYTYNGTAYRIVVSGIDGRTFGERPMSPAKLLGYAGLLTAAALTFGILWGAAGLL